MKDYIRTFWNRESFRQVIKVGVVGVFNTVVSFALFNLLRVAGVSPQWSLAIAFGLTTFMSYLINRRWTFELTDGRVSARETAAFFGINVIAYAVSAGIMELAQNWFGPLDRRRSSDPPQACWLPRHRLWYRAERECRAGFLSRCEFTGHGQMKSSSAGQVHERMVPSLTTAVFPCTQNSSPASFVQARSHVTVSLVTSTIDIS